jgi:hypothetical protein
MKGTKFKWSRTIREYKVKWGQGRVPYDITVPVGSLVNNQTALGCDDNYRFLTNFDTKVLVGYEAGMLAHDLTHYGLNIPAEYCEPYPKDA